MRGSGMSESFERIVAHLEVGLKQQRKQRIKQPKRKTAGLGYQKLILVEQRR